MHYIHTTHKIVSYIDRLIRKHSSDKHIVHLVDEGILGDINNGEFKMAQQKIVNLMNGAIASGAKEFMITCTAAGDLIKDLDAEYQKMLVRIEEPSIRRIVGYRGRIGVVYTNVPVFSQIVRYMIGAGVEESILTPCYVPDAFKAMLDGDTEKHDRLVMDFLMSNQNSVDCYYIAQVSISAIRERTRTWECAVPTIHMAELGIMELRK